jgi:very-short-patch-repair endonuclease
MIYTYNKDLKNVAQKLRREMTKEEKHLWYDFLKLLPITVNRQKNIGNYIVDFFIASKRIVIEIDGCQHSEPEQREKDQQRDDDFERLGITVLRYTNRDVNCKFQAVCADIAKHLEISI